MIFNAPTGTSQTKLALLVLVGMIAVILAVLGFQHIGGYIPCKLCLGQREPYYAAIPVAFLASLSAWRNWPACLTRGALAITGILMIYAMILAIHHAGVEWAWWEGPGDCGGGTTVENVGDLLNPQLKMPSCEEAAGRFLGISFAGWNVVASLALAAIAFRGAFAGTED